VQLAQRFDAEIISADSVQIYRGFDIGSAKPTMEERCGIAHHMIDIAQPDEDYDAMRYAETARSCIAQSHMRGHPCIVVGGTGLWIRALLRGLVDLPPRDSAVRTALEERARNEGLTALHHELSRADPDSAAKIHPRDAVRIIRALEVYQQTGQRLSALRRAHQLGEAHFNATFIVIDLEKSIHERLLQARAKIMLDAGWLAETRALIARYGPQVRALNSVGYRELRAHLEDDLPQELLLPSVVKATRAYAKRQRTWFNAEQLATHRLAPAGVVEPHMLDHLKKHWISGR